MNNYDEFEDRQKVLEESADTDHEGAGIIINWLFLIVGIAITGAATHFLTSRATSNAPIYQQFLGSGNAAWLTVFILEGSLVGLLIGQQSFFKEQDQRKLAKVAQYLIWLVLLFNTVAAFVMWSKGERELPKFMQLYCTWALPALVCAAILLWKELWTRRRKGKQQVLALETNAQVNDLWRKQYVSNTAAYQKAVQKASFSEPIQKLREALAFEDVVKDLAKQHNKSEEDVRHLLASTKAGQKYLSGQTVDAEVIESSPRLPELGFASATRKSAEQSEANLSPASRSVIDRIMGK